MVLKRNQGNFFSWFNHPEKFQEALERKSGNKQAVDLIKFTVHYIHQCFVNRYLILLTVF